MSRQWISRKEFNSMKQPVETDQNPKRPSCTKHNVRKVKRHEKKKPLFYTNSKEQKDP